MLKVGDELKVIEEIRHSKSVKKRTTIGITQQINPHNIILKKIYKGELSHTTSYNISDFKDISKHFYLKVNEKWILIKIKITEHNNNDIGRGRHRKYD